MNDISIQKKEVEAVSHDLIRKISVFIDRLYSRTLHAHKDIEIILVLSGTLSIATAEEQFVIGEGEVAYFNPTQTHSLPFTSEGGCLLLVIQADPSFCLDYYPAMRNLFFTSSDIARHMSPEDLETLKSYMFQSAESYFSEADGHIFKCVGTVNLIMSLLIDNLPHIMIPEEAYLSKANFEKRMLRIVNYIYDHYTEKITLKSIADNENLTTSYLSHFFTKHLHKSFQDFVNELRFEKALYLLKNSDMKILDVCIESGFSDSKYLNRMFLASYGVTPKEFRKEFRKENFEKKPSTVSAHEYIYSREESIEVIQKIINTAGN